MAQLNTVNLGSSSHIIEPGTNTTHTVGDLNDPCNEVEQVDQDIVIPTRNEDITIEVHDKPEKDNEAADGDSGQFQASDITPAFGNLKQATSFERNIDSIIQKYSPGKSNAISEDSEKDISDTDKNCKNHNDKDHINEGINVVSSIENSIKNALLSNSKSSQNGDKNGEKSADDSIDSDQRSAETLKVEANPTTEAVSFPKRTVHPEDKPDIVKIYKELLPDHKNLKENPIQAETEKTQTDKKRKSKLLTKEDKKDQTKDTLKDPAKVDQNTKVSPKKTSLFKRFSFSKKRNSEPIVTVEPKAPEGLRKLSLNSSDNVSIKDSKKPSLLKRMNSIGKKSSNNKSRLDKAETMSLKSDLGNDSPRKADTPRSGTFSSPRSYDSMSSDGLVLTPRDDLEELRKAKQNAKQDKTKSFTKRFSFRKKKDASPKKLDDSGSLKQSCDVIVDDVRSLPVMSSESASPYEQDISNVLAKFGVAPKQGDIELSPNSKEGDISDTSSVSSRTNSLERKPKTDKKKRFTMKRFGLSKKAKSVEAIGDLEIIDSENDVDAKDDEVDSFEKSIQNVINKYSPEKMEPGLDKDNKIQESMMDKKKERKPVGISFSFGFRKDKPKSRDTLPAKHSCVDSEMSPAKKSSLLVKTKKRDDEPGESNEVSNNNKGEVPSDIQEIQAIENDLKNNIPTKMDTSIKLSNRYEDLVRQQMANGGRADHGSRSNSRSGSEFSQSDSRYRQTERNTDIVADSFDNNSEKQRGYYNNVDNVRNWQARNGSMASEQELNQFFSGDNISRPGSDRGSERGSQGLDRTSERGSLRGSERDFERDSLRGSERGSVRGSIRGSERGSVRESLRGSERGSVREQLRGSERGFDRDSLRGSERESFRGSDRDLERDSLRGSDRESFRGSERDFERDSLRASERGSEHESLRGSERGSDRDSIRGSDRGSERGSLRGSERGFERGDSRRSSRRTTPTNSNRQSPVGSDLGRTLTAEEDQTYPGGQAFQPLMKTPLVTNRTTPLKGGSTSNTPAMTNGVHENGLKEELYKLQEREEKVSKLLEEKENDLISAHHEITDLKAQMSKLCDEIDELKNKNSPAYQYTAKLENDKKIDELLREKENLLTEIHKLKQDLANEKRFDSVSQVGATGGGAVPGGGDGPSPLEAYHPNNPSALQRQIDDLTDQLKDLQEAHETAVTSLASAEKKLQDRETGNDVTLRCDLQEAHIENKKLREQLENLEKSQMGDDRLHDEIQHLRDELRSMREQTYQLNEDNIRLREILYDTKRTSDRNKNDTLPKVNSNKNFNSSRDTSYSKKDDRFDRGELYNGTMDNFREKRMDVSDNRLLRHSPGTRNALSSKRSECLSRDIIYDSHIQYAPSPPSHSRKYHSPRHDDFSPSSRSNSSQYTLRKSSPTHRADYHSLRSSSYKRLHDLEIDSVSLSDLTSNYSNSTCYGNHYRHGNLFPSGNNDYHRNMPHDLYQSSPLLVQYLSHNSQRQRSPSPARSDTSDTTIMLATLPPSQYCPKQLVSSTSHVQNGLHSDKGTRYENDLDPIVPDLDDLHLGENRRERSRRLSTGTGSTNSILDEVEDELELSGGRRHIEEYNASTTFGRRSGSPPRSPRDPRLLNSGFRSVSPPPLVTQHNKDLLGPPMEGKFDTKGMRPFAPRSPADCNIGDIIKFTRNGGRVSRGFVKYIGHLHGKNDAYLGVELEHGDSKHDGTYEGQRYFKCKPNKGVFVAFNKVIMVWGN